MILVFGAYSLVPLYRYGLVGTFKLAYANSATTQVCLDLIIALSLIVPWMWRDAKHRPSEGEERANVRLRTLCRRSGL
jgi:hypothetical protein